jgi:glycine C-acetyltransferase
MFDTSELADGLAELRRAGLFKRERELTTAQGARIETPDGPALNFCANNYLGLADNPQVVEAASEALQRWGFGMASVRFICGTQTLHRQLEDEIARFLGTEAAILFPSCFDANGGVFEVLLDETDVVISDQLNHASLIDGIRLCRATRMRYRNADIDDLRTKLESAQRARRRLIVTDGVFSMDGSYAPLPQICSLAERFDAIVLVDDSHAVGFIGPGGRGTPELFGVANQVDVLTGTLGKALGGASGGYVAGPGELIEALRQRARPYLFSNSVAPAVVAGSLQALRIAASSPAPRERLAASAKLFRALMEAEGFTLLPGEHPIVPVMFPGDDGARTATAVADAMLADGVYVIAFSYPVVPRGQARIRVQLSAAHTDQDVTRCVEAFVRARNTIGSAAA